MDMGIKCGVIGDSENGLTEPYKAFFDPFKALTKNLKNCEIIIR